MNRLDIAGARKLQLATEKIQDSFIPPGNARKSTSMIPSGKGNTQISLTHIHTYIHSYIQRNARMHACTCMHRKRILYTVD
jgi:hypothetical protein